MMVEKGTLILFFFVIHGIQLAYGIRSSIARSVFEDSASKNRPLLSCELESLKRKCSIFKEDLESNDFSKSLNAQPQNSIFEYLKWAFETELNGKSTKVGRPAVQAALSKFQRMVMQLDRSDGVGASVDPGKFAERYIDLINTCTRTGGGAWSAAVNGIKYAGLNISDLISFNVERREKSINIEQLSLNCETRLLDFGKDSLNWATVNGRSTIQCQEMIACIFQIVIRYAILNKQLESEDQSVDASRISFNLKVEVPSMVSDIRQRKPFIPHEDVLISLLQFDMNFNFKSYKTNDSVILKVAEEDINKWAISNALY